MRKVTPINRIEDTINKITTLNANATDDQYPSAKAVTDALLGDTTSGIVNSASGRAVVLHDSSNRLLKELVVNIGPSIEGSTGTSVTVASRNLVDKSAFKTEGTLRMYLPLYLTAGTYYWSSNIEELMGMPIAQFIVNEGDIDYKQYIKMLSPFLETASEASFNIVEDGVYWYLLYAASAEARSAMEAAIPDATMQIVRGAKVDQYQPFVSNTHSVSFREPVYGGTYDWKTGKLTKKYQRFVFDGTESGNFWANIASTTAGSGTEWFGVGVDTTRIPIDTFKNTAICNKFERGDKDGQVGKFYIDTKQTSNYKLRFFVPLETASSIEQWKAYLKAQYEANTPLIVVAEVVQPEEITIIKQPMPSTIYPSCTLSADTGDVKVEYLLDTKTHIDTKSNVEKITIPITSGSVLFSDGIVRDTARVVNSNPSSDWYYSVLDCGEIGISADDTLQGLLHTLLLPNTEISIDIGSPLPSEYYGSNSYELKSICITGDVSSKQNTPVRLDIDNNNVFLPLYDNLDVTIIQDLVTLDVRYPDTDFIASLRFTIANQDYFDISFPSTTKYIGGVPDFKPGQTWELNIKNGVVVGGLIE